MSKKNQNVQLVTITVISLVGLVGFFLGRLSNQALKNVNNKSITLGQKESNEDVQPLFENPELYVDKQKGIAFLYPKDEYQVKEVDESQASSGFAKLKGYNSPKLLWGLKVQKAEYKPFTVWVFDNSSRLNLQNWYEKYSYYPDFWGDAVSEEIEKMKPVSIRNIDGVQAYGYDAGPTPSGYAELMYVERGDKMYLFQLYGDSVYSLDDQILSTFKFLTP